MERGYELYVRISVPEYQHHQAHGHMVSDRLMKERAELVAAKLKQDDGVSKAIRLIYAYLPISTREGSSARNSSTPVRPQRRSSSVLVPSPTAA